MSQNERYLKANQAGQAFEIATVEAVTGVHIDHFVEANLIGFYYLAQAFGGIEVCVKPWSGNNGANLRDSASGWDALNDGYNLRKGGAQYLHLAAPQALAFVRARDTLPGIDLGRTKRQQAVVDYVVWKLKNEGAFSDLGLLNKLLGTASQYLITDSDLRPARLRHQHARAQRQPPEVPDPADFRPGERHAAQRLGAGRQSHQRALHPAGT